MKTVFPCDRMVYRFQALPLMSVALKFGAMHPFANWAFEFCVPVKRAANNTRSKFFFIVKTFSVLKIKISPPPRRGDLLNQIIYSLTSLCEVTPSEEITFTLYTPRLKLSVLIVKVCSAAERPWLNVD